LNDRDVERLGPLAKCAPPLRDEKRRKALWADLRAGRIQTVGSDHSPSRPEMKIRRTCLRCGAVSAACSTGLSCLMSECEKTADKDLPILAAVLARNVARRFQIDDRKGAIALGRDADFSLIEYGKARTIKEEDLWTRHRISAYVGEKSRVRVTHTYVRGTPVYAEGGLRICR
jgi:allantoinase